MTLPNTYRQLDFIQSSGGQYINLNYVPNSSTKIIIDFRYVATSGNGYNRLFGTQKDGSGKTLTLRQMSSGGGNIYFEVGPSSASVGMDKNAHRIVFNDNGITYIDNNPAFTETISNNIASSLWAFGTNEVYQDYAIAQIINIEIYQSGALVRKYIPAERLSDHEIGLYDLQNDVFYTNSGSGKFYGGIENIILEDNPLSFNIADDVSLQANFEKQGGGKKYIIAS